MGETYLEDIAVGQTFASEPHAVTSDEIARFCDLSGDFNPLHTDDEAARAAGFRERIAHGLLVLSVTSGMPTEADDWALNAYLEESRRFVAPVYPGDAIRTVTRVSEVRRSRSDPGRGIVTTEVEVVNQDGEVVQTGTDVVMVAARTNGGETT
ncbi:MAG: MaoC family dehydratase [Planctomycetaceae bacterium]